MREKIILSTDIGTDVDDALSLYLCTKRPEINLTGVYVTSGDVNTRAKIARRMLSLTNYQAIVGIGESEPISKEVMPYHTGFEKDILTKEDKQKNLEELGIEIEGISSLERKATENNCTIASIAPLTTIARILELNPKLENKIYIMGGREGKVEHNFFHDVKAAQIVLDSDMDITLVTADICDKYRLPSSYLLEGNGSEIKRYLSKNAFIWGFSHALRGLRDLQTNLSILETANRSFYVPDKVKRGLDKLLGADALKKSFEDRKRDYSEFCELIKKNKFEKYPSVLRYIIGETLKEAEIKDFSVSDAYVIYSIIYPDKTKKEEAEIKIDENGIMTTLPGEKHKIITDIDYRDFESFLIESLK